MLAFGFWALSFGVSACGKAENKVTDPSSPGFEIEKFDVRDYKDFKKIAEVFRIYFPIGTDRSFIDDILVTKGKVRISRTGPFSEVENLRGLGHGAEHEKILKNFSAKYYVHYDLPYDEIFPISITPSVSRAATAFYDENDKLRLLFVGTELVNVASN